MKRARWVCVTHGGLWGSNETCPECARELATDIGLRNTGGETTNANRAAWAKAAVLAYAAENRHYAITLDPDSFDEIVGDLLGDLRHLRDEIGRNFPDHGTPGVAWGDMEALNQRGFDYYDDECKEEENG